MSAFDEYITKLEGQENIDPVKLASDLHELHSVELGVREAKINQLSDTTAEKDAAIAERDAEILKWKAKNFDLAMSLPADLSGEKQENVSGKPDASTITINDLFTEPVRNRHGR